MTPIHDGFGPDGAVEVKIPPASSPARHSEVDAHDTANSAWPRSIGSVVQAPVVGAVEMRTSPASSTATQKDELGQSMPLIGVAPSMF